MSTIAELMNQLEIEAGTAVVLGTAYRIPILDLGLSGYAEHLRLHESSVAWVSDNCRHCQSILLGEIDELLEVLRGPPIR